MKSFELFDDAKFCITGLLSELHVSCICADQFVQTVIVDAVDRKKAHENRKRD